MWVYSLGFIDLKSIFNFFNNFFHRCSVRMCFKIFSAKSSLNRHIANQHSNTIGKENYPKVVKVCCDIVFNSKKSYNNHLLHVHNRPFPKEHSCDICEKSLMTKVNAYLRIGNAINSTFSNTDWPMTDMCYVAMTAEHLNEWRDEGRWKQGCVRCIVAKNMRGKSGAIHG